MFSCLSFIKIWANSENGKRKNLREWYRAGNKTPGAWQLLLTQPKGNNDRRHGLTSSDVGSVYVHQFLSSWFILRRTSFTSFGCKLISADKLFCSNKGENLLKIVSNANQNSSLHASKSNAICLSYYFCVSYPEVLDLIFMKYVNKPWLRFIIWYSWFFFAVAFMYVIPSFMTYCFSLRSEQFSPAIVILFLKISS